MKTSLDPKGQEPARRFLVLDDIEINCRVTARLLSALGHCDIATDVRKALGLFQEAWKRNEPYDVLFLDIMMPKVNGVQFLQVIREMEKRMQVEKGQALKVIVVTSTQDSNVQLKLRSLGVSAVVLKPINRNELLRCVKRLTAGEPEDAGGEGTSEPKPEAEAGNKPEAEAGKKPEAEAGPGIRWEV